MGFIRNILTGMLLTITLSVIYYPIFSSATIKPMTQYQHARYEPIDAMYMFSQLTSMNSSESCVCQCLSNQLCSMASYFGFNQTCFLYLGKFNKEELRVAPRIWNATLYNFGNFSASALKVFNLNNESVYGIWNTIAGGNSSSAEPGYTAGTYWYEQSPSTVFDQNVTSFYTNHGACYYLDSDAACGVNTGLYFTVNNGPIILKGFYFVTSFYNSIRDPLTITIEGSNQNSSFLTLGTSWTLIYNGSAGLTIDPGRTTKGEVRVLQNLPTAFSSYRLLVTSKRGSESSVSYAEFVMIYN